MASKNESGNGSRGSLVPAVDRAARIVEAVASSESPLGVSELSRQLHLNKSTTHDILSTLCHHRLLERDDATKTYRLGYALVELRHRMSDRMDWRAMAHPHVVALSRAVNETVFLGTFGDGQVIIEDKEEAAHDVKITSPLGRRMSYSAAAFGKIFLAAMSEAELSELLSARPLRAYTRKSITKIGSYRAALRQVRAQGFALDDEEYLAGVRAAATPVNDEQGNVIAALCVVGFSTRLPYSKLLDVARQTYVASEEISRQLGAKEYPTWDGIG
ncbi:MAG: IclR family transcriptional regulator [Acidobacteriota bacterium]